LDAALEPNGPSAVAFVGPGGQGKTAVVQHWLGRLVGGGRASPIAIDGVFLWSFYRGKDADLCLRELYGHVAGASPAPDVSATYAVDHLLPRLRRERWVLIFDGAEVAQYDAGPWFGRFVHPELSRLLEELSAEPLHGAVVLTSRFPLPELQRRRHARIVSLAGLDPESARGLLESVGVRGTPAELDAAAAACGNHAKAVELLGTLLARFHGGEAARLGELPEVPPAPGATDEEHKVARVLAAYAAALPREQQDVLALATAFRDPPTEPRLTEYLGSVPVRSLLHATWGRDYAPFTDRPHGWLAAQLDELVRLRLLERVGLAPGSAGGSLIDAHPLVRRAFEHNLGAAGRRQGAQARAGFLHGRPDRRRPATLDEAREEVELFHAYCDAGLWPEADAAYAALDKPRYRFLAPALDRDLLLRFFPEGNWRRPPLWPRFARYRDLAVCLEMLGRFAEALPVYREPDAPLRGDALLALGRLGPILATAQAPHPWQMLWGAYRAHALTLAGRTDEALALARMLVPTDVYEWTHVFECLLRAGRLDALDMRSFLYRPAHAGGHRWADLARQRMRADYLRRCDDPPADLDETYRELVEEYDRGGLPWERALTRLSRARWLESHRKNEEALAIAGESLQLGRRYGMRVIEADALALAGQTEAVREIRRAIGYEGPARP
ncbi:MAG TPA: hypothetical protein VFW33_20690, partial [Gemmataceae bacterium]|nr:hypothetical protein [Gemmataceae bacterium]